MKAVNIELFGILIEEGYKFVIVVPINANRVPEQEHVPSYRIIPFKQMWDAEAHFDTLSAKEFAGSYIITIFEAMHEAACMELSKEDLEFALENAD